MFSLETAIPMYGFLNGLQPDSIQQAQFQAFENPNLAFNTVPRNKLLLITKVVIESNNLATSGMYFLNMGASRERANIFLDNTALAIRGDRTSIQQLSEPNGILFLLEGGQVFKAINEKVSAFTVDLKFRGFLVDQLIKP